MGLNHLQSLICTYSAYDLRPLMSTDVSVNVAISYFLLVINALINIITARKQHLQYMYFNEENFSSS